MNYSAIKKIHPLYRAIVGELDDEMDARIDLSTIRAEPLSSVAH